MTTIPTQDNDHSLIEADPEAQDFEEEPDEEEGPDQIYHINSNGFSVLLEDFALDEKTAQLWMISMIGSEKATKAIWAALLNSPPHPANISVTKRTGAAGWTDLIKCHLAKVEKESWQNFRIRIPSINQHHMLLYHRCTEQNFTQDKSFVILESPAQTMAEQHFNYLNKRTQVPMAPHWADWIWEQARINSEAIPLRTARRQAYYCQSSDEQLTERLSHAIKERILTA